jgi:hypothetical protein
MCILRGPIGHGVTSVSRLYSQVALYGNPSDIEDLRYDAQEGLASVRSVSALVGRIRSRVVSVDTFGVCVFSSLGQQVDSNIPPRMSFSSR